MMAFLQPCSLTEKFIIVSEKTYVNMVGFRVLYLYDVLIQPSSNITSQLRCSLSTTHKYLYKSAQCLSCMYNSSSYTCTSNLFRQTFQAICHTQTPMYRELGLVTTTKTSSQDTNPQLTPNTLYRSNRRSPKKINQFY